MLDAIAELYQVLFIVALARTGVALVALTVAPPERRPVPAVVQGIAEICCALLLRLYADPSFYPRIGAWAFLIFAIALVWAVTVWFRRIWAIQQAEPAELATSGVLEAFGVAVEGSVLRVAGLMWHVMFVAPSLVCGAFVLFGLAEELPPAH